MSNLRHQLQQPSRRCIVGAQSQRSVRHRFDVFGVLDRSGWIVTPTDCGTSTPCYNTSTPLPRACKAGLLLCVVIASLWLFVSSSIFSLSRTFSPLLSSSSPPSSSDALALLQEEIVVSCGGKIQEPVTATGVIISATTNSSYHTTAALHNDIPALHDRWNDELMGVNSSTAMILIGDDDHYLWGIQPLVLEWGTTMVCQAALAGIMPSLLLSKWGMILLRWIRRWPPIRASLSSSVAANAVATMARSSSSSTIPWSIIPPLLRKRFLRMITTKPARTSWWRHGHFGHHRTLRVPFSTTPAVALNVWRKSVQRSMRVLSVHSSHVWKTCGHIYKQTSLSKIVNRSKKLLKVLLHGSDHNNNDDNDDIDSDNDQGAD